MKTQIRYNITVHDLGLFKLILSLTIPDRFLLLVPSFFCYLIDRNLISLKSKYSSSLFDLNMKGKGKEILFYNYFVVILLLFDRQNSKT